MNESDVAMVPAVARRRLPPRRHSETRRLAWAGNTIHVTVGYDRDGVEPREIFYSDGYSSGSDMQALVSDLCIALSVMLQHEDVTAATLKKSMGQAFDVRTGDPMPASVLGLLLDELCRPPEWAAAIARGEGAVRNPAGGPGISGEAATARRPSEEARRQDDPGPEGAARRETGRHATDAASGEEPKA
ncbi:MAG: hypothetical protein F4103_02560 [Boseongicola sp. SB0673_bin_14]|nr:hypothetical protein [Boseongicola sp. SB0667_bin_21]MYI67672.1 hypothetical protein [Boseongicola sp. SB0673_bin_14]